MPRTIEEKETAVKRINGLILVVDILLILYIAFVIVKSFIPSLI